MKKLYKPIVCILSVCLLLALAGCGSAPANNSSTTSGSGSPAEASTSGGTEDTRSARDRVYELMDQYPLAFNGVPPKQLADRTGVVKGFPVEQKSDITIGYVTGSVGSPFFTQMLSYLEQATQEAGYNFNYQVWDFNNELCVQQLDAYISQGVDVILANADVQYCGPTFKKAAEAGIPVIATSNQQIASEGNVITDIISSSYKSGWYVGEYTARQIYKTGDVLKMGAVLIQLGTGDTEGRGNGFISGFLYGARDIDGSPYPTKWDAMLDGYEIWSNFTNSGRYDASDKGLNLVGYGQTPNGSSDAPGGQAAANDLVTANQDMDLLYVECDPMWPGVDVVLKQHNLKAGTDVKIACPADGTKEGMEAIQRGELIAIGNNSSTMNAIGMMTLLRNLFEEGKDLNNITPNTFTPTVAITAENVDEYYDPAKPLAEGMPYEFQTVDEYNASVSDTADPF
ncbi:MAG: sugar ABC transporter substrate-binding protein [Peptococcaceae bacterium]|jgi:ribose transport system substrate-binding protein|nr:sugar ABC transporter substrate-binding protein [Peptococcaceae bacterium]